MKVTWVNIQFPVRKSDKRSAHDNKQEAVSARRSLPCNVTGGGRGMSPRLVYEAHLAASAAAVNGAPRLNSG